MRKRTDQTGIDKNMNPTAALTMSALFVALTAVCSWISIPVPGTAVPINLATFAVLLAGVTLGRKYGVFSIAVYLILGAVGVPVFHGFTGGMGIALGPTGGFLVGYLALAFMGGVYHDLTSRSAQSRTDNRTNENDTDSRSGPAARDKASALPLFILCAIIGELILYALGVLWFMHLTGSGIAVALASCVVSFIPGDIIKTILVYATKTRLRKIL